MRVLPSCLPLRLLLLLAAIGAADAALLAPPPAHIARSRAVPPARAAAASACAADLELTPDDDITDALPKKAKAKTDRFQVQFTCNVCEGANTHSISRHAYTKGTVIATCPGCKSAHLIADNLNWIEDDFRNLEEFMARRGTPVTRVVSGGTAVAATAAAAARAAQSPAASGSRAEGGGEEIARLEGITEDMALRIRQAVRERKRRKAQEGEDAGGDA
ncbi:hypothetical protein AB1Y20_006500 [Prymnesium parvum]|uniref:DNL-type domain-containing protein n=1 Tax=Prymnesium parvum TaxID=97485 RepID=A0AB34IYN3_PRYPA